MNIKRLLLIVAALAICPMITFAYVIPSSHTFTATVLPTGGVQTWDAVVRNVSNNAVATQVQWSGVTAAQQGYKVADQYIEVSITITNLINWRMLVYTNNTNYTGNKSTAATKGFGLVGQIDTKYGLPVAWKVLESTEAVTVPLFSLNRGDGTQGFTDYMWKFVQDKNLLNVNLTSAWDPASTYVRVWDNTGFYWSENPALAGLSADNKIYMYLASDFTHSLAQTYSTNSLTLDVLQL
ncbi:MAG: hypothetical protein LHV68_04595 [Elusimicrobia bacterium]|nr:hypothetical protein [Candidatus Liberimonas magnetica]